VLEPQALHPALIGGRVDLAPGEALAELAKGFEQLGVAARRAPRPEVGVASMGSDDPLEQRGHTSRLGTESARSAGRSDRIAQAVAPVSLVLEPQDLVRSVTARCPAPQPRAPDPRRLTNGRGPVRSPPSDGAASPSLGARTDTTPRLQGPGGGSAHPSGQDVGSLGQLDPTRAGARRAPNERTAAACSVG
jgi:hypothetical protein